MKINILRAFCNFEVNELSTASGGGGKSYDRPGRQKQLLRHCGWSAFSDHPLRRIRRNCTQLVIALPVVTRRRRRRCSRCQWTWRFQIHQLQQRHLCERTNASCVSAAPPSTDSDRRRPITGKNRTGRNLINAHIACRSKPRSTTLPYVCCEHSSDHKMANHFFTSVCRLILTLTPIVTNNHNNRNKTVVKFVSIGGALEFITAPN